MFVGPVCPQLLVFVALSSAFGLLFLPNLNFLCKKPIHIVITAVAMVKWQVSISRPDYGPEQSSNPTAHGADSISMAPISTPPPTQIELNNHPALLILNLLLSLHFSSLSIIHMITLARNMVVI